MWSNYWWLVELTVNNGKCKNMYEDKEINVLQLFNEIDS